MMSPVHQPVVGGPTVLAGKMRKKWKNMQLHGNIIIIGLQYI